MKTPNVGYQSFLDRKGLKDWMHDKKRVAGCTQKNLDYLRRIKQIDGELARIGTLTFFLLTRLHVDNCRAMMSSAKKQRELLWAVKADLKKYALDDTWEKRFDYDLSKLQTSIDHRFFICRENLRLTEHWPYFEAIGFERLLDFETAMGNKQESVLDDLIPEMEAWEAHHKADIAAYMETIRPELEAYEAHKAKVKADAKAEKEARKAAKKAENEEVREIRENNRKEEIRMRKWKKEMETTMRHAGMG